MQQYTRRNPSPRYQRLLALYREMHREGETRRGIPPDETFPGKSLPPQAGPIKRLIDLTGARTVLDYGSGKGQQYVPMPVADEGGTVHLGIPAWWGVDVTCHDPGYPPYAALPTGRFDGVISTDVLEHCPEEDMPWIVAELFAYATRFVFANVACYPARKLLPNGANAHCTIRPAKWWRAVFERAARDRPEVLYQLRLHLDPQAPEDDSRAEKVITNEAAWQAQRESAR